jgi:lipopolysaccharide export system protein LptC
MAQTAANKRRKVLKQDVPVVLAPPLMAANQAVPVLFKPNNPWGLTMIRLFLMICVLGIIGLGLYVYTPALITKTIPLANVAVVGQDNAVTGLVIQGIDQYQKPFTIHAESARAPTMDADVALEKVRADLTVSQQYPVSLVADHAIFNQKNQTLHMMGNVVLLKQAESFRLKELLIDLKTQEATSFSGVNAALPMGNIMADGLRITDKGKTITFEGKSQFIRGPTQPMAPERP